MRKKFRQKLLLFPIVFAILFVGSAITVAKLADVPVEMRQENWAPYGEGSCVHASVVTMLRWHGMDELAAWWRDTYHSGETATGLLDKLDQAGLKYAYTDTGDVAFLEWASRNRLVVGLPYTPAHFMNLVDLTSTKAVLLDNNSTDKYIYIDRDVFLNAWKNRYSGFAFVLVYPPQPPWPEF